MGRPTRAQQRRRQHSEDRIAKQAESGRQPWLFKSYSNWLLTSMLRSRQPHPPLLKLTDARQQLAEAQQQLTALHQQLAEIDTAQQQMQPQLAEKEQQVEALQARVLELKHCLSKLELESRQVWQQCAEIAAGQAQLLKDLEIGMDETVSCAHHAGEILEAMEIRGRQLELERARQLHEKEKEVYKAAHAQEQIAEQLARVKEQLQQRERDYADMQVISSRVVLDWKAEKAPKRQHLQRYCLENGIKHKQADGIPDLCKALIASGVKPAQQPKPQGQQQGRQRMQQQQQQQQQGRPRKGPQQLHAAPGTHSTPRKG